MSGERDPEQSSGSRSPVTEAASPEVLLEVVDLSKSFGPVRAVQGLSLDVRAGEVHAVCGHNGAGKSTLVKSLVGLVRPDEGTIRFRGRGALAPEPARRAGSRHRAREPGAQPRARAERRGQHLPGRARRASRSTGGGDSRSRLAPSSTSSAWGTFSSGRRSRRSRSANASSSRSHGCSCGTRAC